MRKLWKTICAVVLPLCMIVPALPAAAADSGIRTSAIVYVNAGGQVQRQLNPGVTLHAKVAAVSDAGERELLFVETLYQDGKLIDIGAERQTVGTDGQTDFDVSVQLPDDVTGCSVNTSLWDSAVGMNAICSSSLFPTNEGRLRSISVNGAPIEGFSPGTYSYTMTVDPTSTAAPVIQALPIDGATSVSVDPGVRLSDPATIRATGADGDEENYSVKFDYDTSELVKNFSLLAPGSAFGWTATIQRNLQPSTSGEPRYYFCDRTNQTISDVAPEYRGLDYVIGSIDWANGGNNDTTNAWIETDENGNPKPHDWYTFEVTRDVVIRVFVEAINKEVCFPTSEGWVQEIAGSTPYLVRTDNTGATNNVTIQYSKTIHLDGAESVPVTINSLGGGFPYIVAFDWIYDETGSDNDDPVVDISDTTLSYIRYNGQLIDGFDPAITEYEMEGFDPTLFSAAASSSAADLEEELILGYPYSIMKYTVSTDSGASQTYKVKMKMTTVDFTEVTPKLPTAFLPEGSQVTYPLVEIPVADVRKKESVILNLQGDKAPMSTDRDFLAQNENRMENIDEMLQGMDYVVFENAQSAAWKNAENIQTGISLNITADADVYVAAFTDANMPEGFEKMPGSNFFQLNWTGCGWPPPFNALYKKTVELNGEDSVKIDIPTPGANTQHYHYIFIDLKD